MGLTNLSTAGWRFAAYLVSERDLLPHPSSDFRILCERRPKAQRADIFSFFVLSLARSRRNLEAVRNAKEKREGQTEKQKGSLPTRTTALGNRQVATNVMASSLPFGRAYAATDKFSGLVD